jgi:hypothetical protein
VSSFIPRVQKSKTTIGLAIKIIKETNTVLRSTALKHLYSFELCQKTPPVFRGECKNVVPTNHALRTR